MSENKTVDIKSNMKIIVKLLKFTGKITFGLCYLLTYHLSRLFEYLRNKCESGEM